MFYMGNRSLLLVAVTGFNLVFTLQSRPTLLEFGAVLGCPMVSISIIREIGPIITALICAGRIGSVLVLN
jgi:phospholipid/cholesterol/gamma-HCH transport system permease protein